MCEEASRYVHTPFVKVRVPGYITLIGDKAPPTAHAIEVRLHVHKVDVVIRRAQLVFEKKPIIVGRIF